MSLSSARIDVRPAPAGSRGRRRVLIIPGARYSADHPLLYWAAEMLVADGWQVNSLRWDAGDVGEDPAAFIEVAAIELERAAPRAATTLVLGKSLGSYSAEWAATKMWPAVWLTPLMTEVAVRNALENSANATLAIGGTNDPWWTPPHARTGLQAVEIVGADHALHHPDWIDSIDTLKRVTGLIERFAQTMTQDSV